MRASGAPTPHTPNSQCSPNRAAPPPVPPPAPPPPPPLAAAGACRPVSARTRASGGRRRVCSSHASKVGSNPAAPPAPAHGWSESNTAATLAAYAPAAESGVPTLAPPPPPRASLPARSSARAGASRRSSLARLCRCDSDRSPRAASISTTAVPLESDAKGEATRRPTPLPRHTLAHIPQMGGQSATLHPPHCSISTRSPSEIASSCATRRLPRRSNTAASAATAAASAAVAPVGGAAWRCGTSALRGGASGCDAGARRSPLGWSGYRTVARGDVHEGAGPALAPHDEAKSSDKGARSSATPVPCREKLASRKGRTCPHRGLRAGGRGLRAEGWGLGGAALGGGRGWGPGPGGGGDSPSVLGRAPPTLAAAAPHDSKRPPVGRAPSARLPRRHAAHRPHRPHRCAARRCTAAGAA